MFKNIIIGVGVFAALIAFLAFSCKIPTPMCTTSGSNQARVSLTMWGTVPADDMNDALSIINQTSKVFSITYTYIPREKFTTTLVQNLADGAGPDLIFAETPQIIAQQSRIVPFPYTNLSVNQFSSAYVEAGKVFLGQNGVLALPVSIEPLMLFSNQRILDSHGITVPPATWEDVLSLAGPLRQFDASNKITEHSVALGANNNVLYQKDIVMAMVQMLGQNIALMDGNKWHVAANDPLENQPLIRPLSFALNFVMQFSDPSKASVYTWSPLLTYSSLDAFVSDRLALYVGYSGDAKTIQEKNGRIRFTMSELPQASGYPTSATAAKMYGVAVLRRTPANVLSGAMQAQAALGGSQFTSVLTTATGGLSPLRAVLQSDQNIDAEVRKSTLMARSWYDINETVTSQYFSDMMQAVSSGRMTSSEAADEFVSQMENYYNR